MITIPAELEDYIYKHTSPENPLLKELDRETNLKVLFPRMLSGHLQGKILEMLSFMLRPDYILEIGTYTGYSAICLASGLKKDGQLHTIEINDELADFTSSYIKRSAVSEKIIMHIGDALDIIPTLNIEFDLVFIDGDKRQYLEYYHTVFDKVPRGGFIIADNILWSGKVAEKIKENDDYTKGIIEFNKFVHDDPRVENVILPIRDGLMLVRKI